MLEGLHFTGFSNFDIKYDQRDGKYKAFEINCRQGRSNYYVTGAGHNIARLLVEDRIQHQELPFLITSNRSLWRMVPQKVAFDFTPKRYHQEMKALIRAGADSHSLVYGRDAALKAPPPYLEKPSGQSEALSAVQSEAGGINHVSEMRRSKQQLSQEETEAVLTRGPPGSCPSWGDGGYPYGVPLSYVYHDGKLYFHWALSGHKLDAVRACPKASFCVVDRDQVVPPEYTTYFRSPFGVGGGNPFCSSRSRGASNTTGEPFFPTLGADHPAPHWKRGH